MKNWSNALRNTYVNWRIYSFRSANSSESPYVLYILWVYAEFIIFTTFHVQFCISPINIPRKSNQFADGKSKKKISPYKIVANALHIRMPQSLASLRGLEPGPFSIWGVFLIREPSPGRRDPPRLQKSVREEEMGVVSLSAPSPSLSIHTHPTTPPKAYLQKHEHWVKVAPARGGSACCIPQLRQ